MQVIFTDLKTAQNSGYELWGYSSGHNMFILRKEDNEGLKEYAFASTNDPDKEDR